MNYETYVIDTCTLIYSYCDLKASWLLHSLFPEGIYIVPEVKNELIKLAKKGRFYHEILADLQSGFFKVEEVDIYNQEVQSFLSKFEETLDRGERFSAALALSRGYTLLTDDWIAQQVMMFGLVGLTCKGASWILNQGRKKRLITPTEHKNWRRRFGRQGEDNLSEN